MLADPRPKESDVPGFLQGTTWMEFRQSIDEADGLHRLIRGIRGIPPGRGSGSSIAPGECPYIGLKTFQPDDAPLFFGRTAKIQEVVDRLRSNFGTLREARFMALIGASGSGKSSLALGRPNPCGSARRIAWQRRLASDPMPAREAPVGEPSNRSRHESEDRAALFLFHGSLHFTLSFRVRQIGGASVATVWRTRCAPNRGPCTPASSKICLLILLIAVE